MEPRTYSASSSASMERPLAQDVPVPLGDSINEIRGRLEAVRIRLCAVIDKIHGPSPSLKTNIGNIPTMPPSLKVLLSETFEQVGFLENISMDLERSL